MNYQDSNAGQGLGIASLVLGIIGVLVSCIPFAGLFFGLIGLGLGIAGLIRANKVFAKKSLIIVGIVLSSIAFAIGGIWGAVFIRAIDSENDIFENINNFNKDIDNDYFNINEDLLNDSLNFDSLKVDDETLKNLEKSMDDLQNGPGEAPKKK